MSGMMMKSVQKQKKRKINKALFPFTTNKWSEGICKKKKAWKIERNDLFCSCSYQYELSSFILFTVNIVLRNANYNGDTEALGQELKAKGQVCLSPRVPIENRWIHREFEWKTVTSYLGQKGTMGRNCVEEPTESWRQGGGAPMGNSTCPLNPPALQSPAAASYWPNPADVRGEGSPGNNPLVSVSWAPSKAEKYGEWIEAGWANGK